MGITSNKVEVIPEGTRGRVKSELKKRIGETKKRQRRNRINVKGAYNVLRKKSLESLDPLLQLNWIRT